MQSLEQKTTNLEKLVDDKTPNSRALALSFRQYMLYRLGAENGVTKAYRSILPYYQARPSAVSLFLAVLFYHIEMGSLEKAADMLQNFKKYTGYYKNNDPLVYGVYLYLTALLELSHEKNRNAQKNKKKLDDFNQKHKISDIDLLSGDLSFRMGNPDEGVSSLERAFQQGNNSFYLYILLYDLFKSGYNAGDSLLFIPFLRWACAQDVLREYHVAENAYALEGAIKENFLLIEEINSRFSPEWLLRMICVYCISNNDCSKKAFHYYQEAGKRQITVLGREEMMMKAAYVNHIEALDNGTLRAYLQKGSIDIDLMAFVFHLLLSNKEWKPLIREFLLHNEIIKFAAYSLSSNMTGRYYNSLYRYALETFVTEDQALAAMAAEALYKNLFSCTLRGDDEIIADLYVHEAERKDVGRYRLLNGACTIKTSSPDFRIILIDRESRTIIPHQPLVVKEIETEDLWLYEFFYQRGYRDDTLIIALANNYILMENPPENCSEILRQALSLPGLSQEFIINLSAAMGNILAADNQYDLALKYYENVDENYLNEELIDLMLAAYINAGDLKKAIVLILKKREYISERTLFTALKKLGKREDYQPLIADAAYELILNSWYDSELLGIVLKYYNAGQQEWQRLSEALDKMSIQEIRLDEIILQNSIWMRDFSKAAQMVFVRLYKAAPENQYVDEFVYYASYEMLKNNVKPEYELLAVLEKVYKKTGDRLLCYGLVCVYTTHNVTTLVSEKIMKDGMAYMEEDEFILPVLKEIKDKTLLSPYIEKNQPFIYQSAPDKKVVLNYRFGNDGPFIQKEMRYLKFGMFYIVVPLFHDEEITYFFCEEMERGSIATKEYKAVNTKTGLRKETNDIYYLVNNALIYNKMFKYDEAERIIEELLKQGPVIKGQLI